MASMSKWVGGPNWHFIGRGAQYPKRGTPRRSYAESKGPMGRRRTRFLPCLMRALVASAAARRRAGK